MKEILEFNFLTLGSFTLNLYDVIAFIAVIILARILFSVMSRILTKIFKRRKIDSGRQHAFLQIFKYFIYTIALIVGLEVAGLQISILLGGAAALLVGIGLGLQQTFNDMISGIILLMEGSVEIGDIMEVEGLIGNVTEIGIRTSKLNTRDSISVIIPNSKLVCDKAINWSHDPSPTRFQLKVGVSYSSDVDLVTNLLLQAASVQEEIFKSPAPSVHFADFGNSSLDFTLHFYTMDYLNNERTKSSLRYRLMQLFRENDIVIPFPQQDLWIRNPEDFGSNDTKSILAN